MVYRVDATDGSVPQAHVPLDQQSASESGVLTYATGIGLGGEMAQLGANSTVVIAGVQQWPIAPDLAQPDRQTSNRNFHDSNHTPESASHQSTEEASNDDGRSDETAGQESSVQDTPVQDPPAAKHPQSPTGFSPVWEVDQLSWPESCNELFGSQAAYFRHAGDKLREASGQGLRVLAIVSSRLGEGCTTLAMCLARAVAAGGGRVALLDCNLQHSALSATLGLEFSRGWQDAASGRMRLGEVAVSSISDGITLFPLADIHEPIEPSQLSELLRQATAAADLVILDTGPLRTGHSCPIESGSSCPVNAALVVRDLRTTSEQETLDTVANLKDLGIEAIGVAENYAADIAHAAA